MSDFLTHECGIAAVRLRKPLAYYFDRYGTNLWGLNKLFLLMEKQRNRGQDGTGIGCVKLNMPNGQPYVQRRRGIEKDALAQIYRKEIKDFYKLARKGILEPKTRTASRPTSILAVRCSSATCATAPAVTLTSVPAIRICGAATGPRALSW